MGYQILRTTPVHCPIRDGIIGSKTTALPNSYETIDCAIAIMGRLEQDNSDGCGDDIFGVAKYGTFKCIYRRHHEVSF